ncbi:MAG: hypothetical protein Q8K82_03980 [Gemmatimonadaceae bacterium]|nr:hypothetical protein [Gemmatimonadaceae bacterium]
MNVKRAGHRRQTVTGLRRLAQTRAPLLHAVSAMGVHFLNLQAIGATLQPARPQVLIYGPSGEKRTLVAAEWFVPKPHAADRVPEIFGRTLEGPMEGHRPLMLTGLHHDDPHVWLWKHNPAAVFSPTNPAEKCPATGYSTASTGEYWRVLASQGESGRVRASRSDSAVERRQAQEKRRPPCERRFLSASAVYQVGLSSWRIRL